MSSAQLALTLRRGLVPLILVGLLVLAALLGLALGALRLPLHEVTLSLLGRGDSLSQQVVLDLRLPRVLVSLLCGAMFALSGALLQGVVRNPLASPDLIGVGAGAGLAVTVLLLALPSAPGWLLPWGAVAGAWLGYGLTYTLAVERGGRLNPVRLALVGVAVAAALGALESLVLIRAPEGVGGALAFLSGTVYGADYTRLWRVLPWALLLLPVPLLSRQLDVLALGEGVATSLGLPVTRSRTLALLLAVALAGAATVGAGILGFVGLIAPHLARRLVGHSHALMLPVSALLGALLVVVADTLGRALLPPFEIPAGVLTTVLGAPYFLYLLRRSRGQA